MQHAEDMRASNVLVCLSVLAACSSEPGSESVTTPISDLPITNGYTEAGLGWANRPVPQHQNDVVTLTFYTTPFSNGEAIDAVIGLSSQAAHAFSDMGPIVRYNPSGFVDARDGGSYRADIAFGYTANTEYQVRMVVDLSAKRYSVEIRLADSRLGDPWHPLATSYAFRTEQAGLSRIDNLALFIDSPSGAVSANTFTVTPDICISGAPGWISIPFPTQTGQFAVEADVTPAYGGTQPLDLVVGLSRNAPTRFTDLAAILRFRPDGTMDVRNGSVYENDVPDEYVYNETYHVNGGLRVYYIVTQTAETYTIEITDLNYAHGGSPQGWLATNYAFRTEQSSVPSIGWIGGFVDGPGAFQICNVVASVQQ